MNQLAKIVESCRYLLNNSPEGEEVKNYLNSRIAPEAQEKFAFGYFPDTLKLKLLTSLIGEDTLRNLGLLYTKNYEDSVSARSYLESYFANQPLIMPYRDVYGNVIAIVGRSLLEDSVRREKKIEKYKNTVFKKGQHLFGLYECKEAILKKDFVYIVEGQFDVIKAMERGIDNIVALGNSNMTDYQAALLSRYTKNFMFLLDNDTAGEKGRKLAENKFGNVVNINNIHVPEGYKDIDDYLKDNAGDSLMFASKNSKIYY